MRIAGAIAAIATLGACDGGDGDPGLGGSGDRLISSAWLISDVGDFNADGMDDVLWDDTAQSKMAVWLLSGTGVLQRGATIPGPSGAAWSAAWATDFNADTLADVRWYDYLTGESAVWLMNGTKVLLQGPTFPGPTGGTWVRVTSADFNADGMSDLLWRSSDTAEIQVWLMSGTAPTLKGAPVPPPTGGGWIATSTGDFNADGLRDVLWYNVTGRLFSIALMSATTLLTQGPTLPAPGGEGLWSSISATDFNGDRMADVLWYNAVTQRMTVWLMAGTELLLPGPEIPAPPGGDWSAATTGDVNGDGMSDVIWENTVTHRFAVWLMNGTDVLVAGPEMPEQDGP
jgi:VCBS repeat protein